MFKILIEFVDGHQFLQGLNNKDILDLTVEINQKSIENGKEEAIFSLKIYSIPFLIAPLKNIYRYELLTVNVDETQNTNIDKFKEKIKKEESK